MSAVPFLKMSGAGNDFILIDNRSGSVKPPLAQRAQKLCDRKRSIGADGLILLQKSKKADVRMRIFNPDGSEAEMCGNGVRCLAKFAADKKITRERLSIETPAGIITARIKPGAVVNARLMEPGDLKLNLEIDLNGGRKNLSFINTGVPHAVWVVDSLEGVDVVTLGAAVRTHPHFAPRGTNVNFISFGKPKGSIAIRTYERGVENETLSCGTGSTAGALVAAALKGLASPVKVKTESGEILTVYFSKKGGRFHDVHLEGPVAVNFEGSVNL